MKKLVIFDVDGTLLDTIETITYHVNKALDTLGLEEVDSSFTQKVLGYSSVYLIEKVLDLRGYQYDQEELKRILELYHKFYQGDVANLTRAYDGIVELLISLKAKGFKLAALSNKPQHTLSVLFDEIDFNKYFDFVMGQREQVAKKPDPYMIYELMDKFEMDKKDLILIGDTEVDFETAKNADIDFVAVGWGFRTKEELMALKPKHYVDRVSELSHLLDKEGDL